MADESQSKCCFDGTDDPLMMRSHDQEWDVHVHDNRLTFEYLSLEVMQAGLPWVRIL
jgi:DNA-3-methyladenine glycosylase I